MLKKSALAAAAERWHQSCGVRSRFASPPANRASGPPFNSRPEPIGSILARMAGTAETVGVVLEELGGLAESVAQALGHTTAGAVVQIASLVFFDAAETAHTVGAIELDEIRKRREQGTAAGRGAYEESRQNFVRRCTACDATLRACNLAKATSNGGKCCPDCHHPAPHDP